MGYRGAPNLKLLVAQELFLAVVFDLVPDWQFELSYLPPARRNVAAIISSAASPSVEKPAAANSISKS